MDTQEALAVIRRVGKAKATAKKEEQDIKAEKLASLKKQVQKIYSEDLLDLLQIGNALMNNDLLTDRLTASGIDHNVGFCCYFECSDTYKGVGEKGKKISAIGWLGGGVCGEYDVILDGAKGFIVVPGAPMEERHASAPNVGEQIRALSSFLKKYPVFREHLNRYLENLKKEG